MPSSVHAAKKLLKLEQELKDGIKADLNDDHQAMPFKTYRLAVSYKGRSWFVVFFKEHFGLFVLTVNARSEREASLLSIMHVEDTYGLRRRGEFNVSDLVLVDEPTPEVDNFTVVSCSGSFW